MVAKCRQTLECSLVAIVLISLMEARQSALVFGAPRHRPHVERRTEMPNEIAPAANEDANSVQPDERLTGLDKTRQALEQRADDGRPKQLGHTQQCSKLLRQLQDQLIDQVIRQRVAEKDHLLMEKWLVDNVNDLHRELKQTEMDFEHYVQVTKNILAQNESHLKRQLAISTSLPLFAPLQTVGPLAGGSTRSSSQHAYGLAEIVDR